MVITERELKRAEKRMDATRRNGYAVSAHYDAKRGMVVVSLHTGIEFAFPTALAEGLAGASARNLAQIEISPAGLGLHWPRLDADVYIPSLLDGALGTSWMAAQLGSAGGSVISKAKAESSRINGRKGGRPRKVTSA